jgi:hypothetical protein
MPHPRALAPWLGCLAGLILGLCAAASCGGGSDGADAAGASDAALDGSPDSAAVDPCVTLCACMDQYCSQATEECMSTCQAVPPSVRACRLQHCGYAQTNPVFHCPHGLGDPDDPNTPDACLAP